MESSTGRTPGTQRRIPRVIDHCQLLATLSSQLPSVASSHFVVRQTVQASRTRRAETVPLWDGPATVTWLPTVKAEADEGACFVPN